MKGWDGLEADPVDARAVLGWGTHTDCDRSRFSRNMGDGRRWTLAKGGRGTGLIHTTLSLPIHDGCRMYEHPIHGSSQLEEKLGDSQ